LNQLSTVANNVEHRRFHSNTRHVIATATPSLHCCAAVSLALGALPRAPLRRPLLYRASPPTSPSRAVGPRRRPLRPPEHCRRLRTLPRRTIFSTAPPLAISGENPAAPPCPAQPPPLPLGVPTGHATPCPLVGVGRLG
jgi:hypothetical protein